MNLSEPLLAAEVQKLKHSVPKGDKKRKKEITVQIAKLEAELDERHQQELRQLRESDKQVWQQLLTECFIAIFHSMLAVVTNTRLQKVHVAHESGLSTDWIQWSLRFKTPLFNNSLHLKTGYQ